MSTNVKAEMEQLIAAYSEIEGPSVKRPLTSEIKRFVSYLLASNGKNSDGEAAFLGSLLGREITSEELANYITAENIFSKEFSTTIPNVFKRNIHNTAASYCYRCYSPNRIPQFHPKWNPFSDPCRRPGDYFRCTLHRRCHLLPG